MATDPFREGTEAHYRDGVYYDYRYQRRRYDLVHYVQLARDARGPVLELGVGTGRVAIAIARAGIDVVGLDMMPAMLVRADERLAQLPRRVRERVELVQGDLRTARLGREFPLVIAPFNVLMHMYTRTAIEEALATVLTHLQPEGRFAFDVLMPDLKALVRDPTRLYKSRPIRHPRDGHRYDYREAFHYDPVGQVQVVSTVLEPLEDPGQSELTQLNHRQFFPQELEALLHYNGFRVLCHEGDFQGADLHGLSESQVVVAGRRDG